MLQCILRTKRGCGLTKRAVFFYLAVLRGNFLRKSNVPEPGRWLLARVWRLPLPLFGDSMLNKSVLYVLAAVGRGRSQRFHCI